MVEHQLIVARCEEALAAKGWDSPENKKRLKHELREIEVQKGTQHVLDLLSSGKKYPNVHNLLCYHLLGICPDVILEQEPDWEPGEFPDIDTDFIDEVRDYMKNVWAPEEFGEEFVSNIGAYGTFGLKSAFIDMARVHGFDRNEVQAITTNLEAKDDEGKPLTYEKALELYEDLKAYVDEHPEVGDSVRRIVHRNTNIAKHAGGLIISNYPIRDLVPVYRGKDGTVQTMWVEGLSGQDLAPVGLVKYDLLSLTNLKQIARIKKLVKERHGITHYRSLEGLDTDWSDIAYLNDPEAIKLANRGDLKCIFQFDSIGIRKMVKGSVSSFDDLAAFSALWRPGPLGMKMQERYVERKAGREHYTIYPALVPILGRTYGVMVFQEQVMKILHVVGKIPLKDCEKVRKAISKKKVELFIKYKEMFIENGMQVLGASREELEAFWAQIESFAEYGFNKSMTIDTLIPTPCGDKRLGDFVPGDVVYAIGQDGNKVETEVVALHDHGILEGFEVTFDDGHAEVCSIDHKFLTEKGQMPLWEICQTRSFVLCDHQDRGSDGEGESGGLDGKVWRVVSHQDSSDGSSKIMLELSSDRLEEEVGRTYRRASVPMRRASQNLSHLAGASSYLSTVRGDQAGEHSAQDGEAQHGQFGTRAEGHLLGDGEGNLSTLRDSNGQGRETGCMEMCEPREVRRMHGSGLEEPQTVPHGILVAGAVGLGDVVYTVRDGSQAGGFREGQDLDRGGWLLPLQRASGSTEGLSLGCGSVSGCSPQRGGTSEGQHHALEAEHGVLCQFDRGDEARMVGLDAGHAPIADTRRLVRRQIVRVVPVGKRRMYDLEVANPTHNFLLTNGVVTSNSHAVAYTYISSRLLDLKAHYPLEFYCGTLMSETQTDKIKEYKLDAQRFGRDIRVKPVDINLSKANFSIQVSPDGREDIYYGMQNLKGIGEAIAEKIEAGQPYNGLRDFLERFGTDAKVCTALILLGAFPGDRRTNFKYYEFYKSNLKKMSDRDKRHLQTEAKHYLKLEECLKDYNLYKPEMEVSFSDEFFDALAKKGLMEEALIDLVKLRKDYQKFKEKYHNKVEADYIPSIDDFNPDNVEIEEKWEEILNAPMGVAEQQFYGFVWVHDLELSPDYQGDHTFEDFRNTCEKENLRTWKVEVKVLQLIPKKTKAGKPFYSLQVEDAVGEQGYVTIWSEDYERFADEFKAGTLLGIRVNPPQPPFPSYTFESPPRHLRWKLPAKQDDLRVVVLRKGSQ